MFSLSSFLSCMISVDKQLHAAYLKSWSVHTPEQKHREEQEEDEKGMKETKKKERKQQEEDQQKE